MEAKKIQVKKNIMKNLIPELEMTKILGGTENSSGSGAGIRIYISNDCKPKFADCNKVCY